MLNETTAPPASSLGRTYSNGDHKLSSNITHVVTSQLHADSSTATPVSAQLSIAEEIENTVQGKLQKSRERNREHARKTRLRKKAHLESLKAKLSELQFEAARLSVKMEESNTANILLCLGSSPQQATNQDHTSISSSGTNTIAPITTPPEIWKGNLVEYIRNMVRSEANLHKNPTQILVPDPSSKSSSDNGDAKTDKEKTDSNSDFGSDNEDGEFEPEQDVEKDPGDYGSGNKNVDTDGLRRERNRMHAKLTRDRKKLFTSRVQQMIKSLERQNYFMKKRLESMEKTTDTSFFDGLQ